MGALHTITVPLPRRKRVSTGSPSAVFAMTDGLRVAAGDDGGDRAAGDVDGAFALTAAEGSFLACADARAAAVAPRRDRAARNGDGTR